ncbi:MAG TPA: rod shape-determining protein MreC [Bacteroidales bacterium]|nr:rod shape-determining protein MreC [Bacteroidales bacterium]
MINILRFLQRHNFFLLFVLLEVVALILLTRSHSYQRAALNTVNSGLVGKIYEVRSDLSNYLSLRDANRKLLQQNAALLSELTLLKTNAPLPPLRDTTLVFDFIPARVISNTVHLRNNIFIIDKGFRDGVRKDMGVIAPEGAAGIVIGVSENYASVMSLLHKFGSISVRFKNNDQLAILQWNGGSYQYGDVVDIPTHIEMHPGDTLLTSGHSLVFPAGVMVGTIDELTQSVTGSLNSARIRYAVDFNKLKDVYVIKNNHRNEIDMLTKVKTHD